MAKIVNGGTPPPDEENWGGPIPWATPADFGDTLSRINSTRRSLTAIGARIGSTIVPPGSILLSTRAPIGHVAINDIPMALNQGCRALVPRSGINAQFLGYQLELLREDLQARGLGTTFLELSSESLAATPVAVPSPAKQERIVDLLDTETARIDALVSRRTRMRSLLTLKRERVIESTIASNGRTASLIPLKYLAAHITVGIVITPAKWYVETDGTPALRGINVKPGKITLKDLVEISGLGDRENQKSRLTAGDIVVVRTGQAGAAAVVPNELDGANCIDLIIIRPGPKLQRLKG